MILKSLLSFVVFIAPVTIEAIDINGSVENGVYNGRLGMLRCKVPLFKLLTVDSDRSHITGEKVSFMADDATYYHFLKISLRLKSPLFKDIAGLKSKQLLSKVGDNLLKAYLDFHTYKQVREVLTLNNDDYMLITAVAQFGNMKNSKSTKGFLFKISSNWVSSNWLTLYNFSALNVQSTQQAKKRLLDFYKECK